MVGSTTLACLAQKIPNIWEEPREGECKPMSKWWLGGARMQSQKQSATELLFLFMQDVTMSQCKREISGRSPHGVAAERSQSKCLTPHDFCGGVANEVPP
jgi:predicted lipoprotein